MGPVRMAAVPDGGWTGMASETVWLAGLGLEKSRHVRKHVVASGFRFVFLWIHLRAVMHLFGLISNTSCVL